MKSRVHSFIHPNCHHQIANAKFNLKIHYPPPYEREDGITTKQMLTTLEKQLIYFFGKSITKSRHKRYDFLFNRTVKNIITSYIPHEIVTIAPPWINENAKQLIIEKNEMYKR